MTTARQRTGRWGESLAEKYLRARGYAIVQRNARTSYGELDIVARQKEVIVFVEVKTRRTAAFGPPEVAITPRKREHLLSAAQAFLQDHPEWDGDWRIDVIAIRQLHPQEPPEIVHFENAIT